MGGDCYVARLFRRLLLAAESLAESMDRVVDASRCGAGGNHMVAVLHAGRCRLVDYRHYPAGFVKIALANANIESTAELGGAIATLAIRKNSCSFGPIPLGVPESI